MLNGDLTDVHFRVVDPLSNLRSTVNASTFHPLRNVPIPSTIWALPGYVDAHRHLPHGFKAVGARERLAERTAALEAATLEGVDTVFDMGVSPPLAWPDRPNRVTSAVCGIDGPHGPPAGNLAVVARTEDDCRRLVGVAAGYGAHFVKIFATGTGKYSKEIATQPKMGTRLVETAVDEAHRHGLDVVAHCMGGPAARHCVELGVHSLEHGLYFSYEDLRLCAERGVRVTLTAGVYYLQHKDRILDRLRELVHDVQRSGVDYLIGTDGHGRTMAAEVLLLNRLGLPLASSLRRCLAGASRATVYTFYRQNPFDEPTALLSPLGVGIDCTALID